MTWMAGQLEKARSPSCIFANWFAKFNYNSGEFALRRVMLSLFRVLRVRVSMRRAISAIFMHIHRERARERRAIFTSINSNLDTIISRDLSAGGQMKCVWSATAVIIMNAPAVMTLHKAHNNPPTHPPSRPSDRPNGSFDSYRWEVTM